MKNRPDHDPENNDHKANGTEFLQPDPETLGEDRETPVDVQQEYVERIMRMQAEFENYRKRVTRDMASAQERATDSLILEILPLYDNVLRAACLHQEPREENGSAVLEGLQQIERQFSQWLESKGIQPIAAVGDLFDPQCHEAVLTVSSDRPRNEVLEELEPGYFRYDRVLRPSKVSVSRGAKEEEPS